MMKDSSEVYDLMEKGQIDFGFASYESSHSNRKHEPVFSQDECLVFGRDSSSGQGPISPADLDPEKEIRLTGGNFSNVAQWRDVWFAGQDRCRVMVNSPHMIVKYLIDPGSWAILPLATARMLSKFRPVCPILAITPNEHVWRQPEEPLEAAGHM